MTKERVVIFLAVLILIPVLTFALIKLASGYRPDWEEKTIRPTGLLAATSYPKGAQVLVNGKLETATDDTLNLNPGIYEVEIKKDGFVPWRKTLKIEKGLVTETWARLFPALPELRPMTTRGAVKPKLSPSGSRLVYLVPGATSSGRAEIKPEPEELEITRTGVWLLELENLPLGFNQEPRQLVVGWPKGREGQDSRLLWSVDSRRVWWIFPKSKEDLVFGKFLGEKTSEDEESKPEVTVYLLNLHQTEEADKLTQVGDFGKLLKIQEGKRKKQLTRQSKKLPEPMREIVATASSKWQFAPDESKLLYVATAAARLKEQMRPPVPAASTQKQERVLKPGGIYVYDLEEDRNFQVDELPTEIWLATANYLKVEDWWDREEEETVLRWFPTSRHLIKTKRGKITLIEYDGMNPAVVYSGPLEEQFAIPHPSGNSLIILTVLNPEVSLSPNLYSLNLK